MRVSGPLVATRPLAPVVSRTASSGLRLGSAAFATATLAKGGGLVSLPAWGTPCRSGGGRVTYGVLAVSGTVMKYVDCGATMNWAAAPKFGPGLPSSLTMPRDNSFEMPWPDRGLQAPDGVS